MRKRRLGETGIETSELGFGCAGFWARPIFSETKAIRLVHLALDLGVTFFDTSAHYQGGEAERRLGKALSTRRHHEAIIATKAGKVIGPDRRIVKDFSPSAVRASVEASLRRLRLDHVHLLQLHSPSAEDLTDDLIECLAGLRQTGLVGACGVSGHGPDLLDRVGASDLLATVMFPYNVVEAGRAAEIGAVTATGTGYIASMPLVQGRFRRRTPPRRWAADLAGLVQDFSGQRETMRRGRAFRFIEDFDGWTGAEVALAYVLQNPHVATAVFGSTSEVHLEQNVMVSGRTLPAEATDRIEAMIASLR